MRISIRSCLLLGVCASVFGCAAPSPPPPFMKPVTLRKSEAQKLTPERLAAVRQVWTAASWSKLATSRVPSSEAPWILERVATSESTASKPCATLELVSVDARELGLVLPTIGSDGKTRLVSNLSYHEAWVVDACGRRTEWRVFDAVENREILVHAVGLGASGVFPTAADPVSPCWRPYYFPPVQDVATPAKFDVVVALKILSTGEVTNVRIKKSSGNLRVDRWAEASVKTWWCPAGRWPEGVDAETPFSITLS